MAPSKIERGSFCPLLKKDCVGLKCSWYIQVRGSNPNTGEEIDHWDCSMAWLPTLLINTANETRQGAAATESFRNEMVAANHTNQQLMATQVEKTERLKEELSKANEIAKFISNPQNILTISEKKE